MYVTAPILPARNARLSCFTTGARRQGLSRLPLRASFNAVDSTTSNTAAPAIHFSAAQTVPASPQSSLADQLLQAESELEAMFDGESLPPTAKQVAAQREKIAHLRALLTGKVSSSMPAGANAALTAAGLANVMSRAVADRTRVALRQTGDKNGILAHQYLDDNELEFALTVEQKWEADWLSAENAKLRRRAFDLLKRQEQLEELLSGHLKALAEQAEAGQLATTARAMAAISSTAGTVEAAPATAPVQYPVPVRYPVTMVISEPEQDLALPEVAPAPRSSTAVEAATAVADGDTITFSFADQPSMGSSKGPITAAAPSVSPDSTFQHNALQQQQEVDVFEVLLPSISAQPAVAIPERSSYS